MPKTVPAIIIETIEDLLVVYGPSEIDRIATRINATKQATERLAIAYEEFGKRGYRALLILEESARVYRRQQ